MADSRAKLERLVAQATDLEPYIYVHRRDLAALLDDLKNEERLTQVLAGKLKQSARESTATLDQADRHGHGRRAP